MGNVISPDLRPEFSVYPTGITIGGWTKSYKTYEEMMSETNPPKFGWCEDATGDYTVSSGGALYINKNGSWVKLYETESMDIDISGIATKLYWNSIYGRPESSVSDIDISVKNTHIHTNKEILNKLGISDNGLLMFDDKEYLIECDWSSIRNKPTSVVSDIDDAVSKRHIHENKKLLDQILPANIHVHTNKALIDSINMSDGRIHVSGNYIEEYLSIDWGMLHNKPRSSVSSIDTAVNQTHTHTNVSILNNLSDKDGMLLYNGQQISGGDTTALEERVSANESTIRTLSNEVLNASSILTEIEGVL